MADWLGLEHFFLVLPPFCSPGVCQLAQLRPGDEQAVVGQRFVGPLLALAERVEPIGQLSGSLADAAQPGQERGRAGFALRFQGANQVLGGFPDGQATVGGGSQSSGKSSRPTSLTLPPRALTTPASTSPATAVFLALESVSATP